MLIIKATTLPTSHKTYRQDSLPLLFKSFLYEVHMCHFPSLSSRTSTAKYTSVTSHHSPQKLPQQNTQVSLLIALLESFPSEVHTCHFSSLSSRASLTNYICATSYHSPWELPWRSSHMIQLHKITLPTTLLERLTCKDHYSLLSERLLWVESTLKLTTRDRQSAPTFVESPSISKKAYIYMSSQSY